MLANFENVLDRLNVASRNGEKAMSFCPVHDDRNSPSLSLKAEDGKLLLNCFAGCRPEDIVSTIGIGMKDLFSGGGTFIPPNTPARVHAQSEKPHANGQNERVSGGARSEHGCTLEGYSEEKKLPKDFLRGLGLRDVTYLDKPAVRIPTLMRKVRRWQSAFASPWTALRSSGGGVGTNLSCTGSGYLGKRARLVTWSWWRERAIATPCDSTRYRLWAFRAQATASRG